LDKHFFVPPNTFWPLRNLNGFGKKFLVTLGNDILPPLQIITHFGFYIDEHYYSTKWRRAKWINGGGQTIRLRPNVMG
jgi:hypothetical protein